MNEGIDYILSHINMTHNRLVVDRKGIMPLSVRIAQSIKFLLYLSSNLSH